MSELQLPKCLAEIPHLLSGNCAHATDMFLSAGPDYNGEMACQMALRLLNDATVRAREKLGSGSQAKCLKIMAEATNLALDAEPNELVRLKLSFCWQILFALISEGKWRDEYLVRAKLAINKAADIIRNAVENEEAENVA